nr:reverse transcriptase domain-containing protein [Tanacetum cinerariifolium]
MATNGNGNDLPPPNGGGDLPVPNLRTLEELCQPTLNSQGEPIAPIAIQATNFVPKNDMIQQHKVNRVSDDTIRLYLFPHSLTHHATAWFDCLPRNSITTFEQMDIMFLGKYFLPSMVTKLRNEITNFRQCLDESLFEAWERYKLSIDRCPNHNMLPVTQIDTFYNGLTLKHRDTINAAVGGTFMKTLKAEMAEINKNLMKVLQINQQVKAVTLSYETCGGLHSYNDCPATVGHTQNVYVAGAYNQGGNSYQPQVEALVSAPKPNPKPSMPYLSRLNDQKLRDKANDQMEKFFQIFQDLNFNISFADALILMPKFALTIKSLSTNKEKFFKLPRTPLNEHCSMVLLKKLPEKLRDPVFDFDVDSRVPLILKISILKTGRALIDVYEGELTLRFGNKAEVLGFSMSGNPTPYTKTIVFASSSTLTPFEDSDFLLEETDAFLATDDEPISPEIDDSYYDSEGDILLLE